MERRPTEDEERLLAYLYACERTGARPTAHALDMSRARLERACEGLVELGFAEIAPVIW